MSRPIRSLASAWSWAIVLQYAHSAPAQTFAQRVAVGLSRPVFVTAPDGDESRLFIAEQHTGRIKIMDLVSGAIAPQPLLDLSGLANGGEQGLLGVAFDPDYADNGFFYVNVTTSTDAGATHIRRYRVDGNPADAVSVLAGSEREILSFNQPQTNHNGGWIGFSPQDGYLYVASGDGGGGYDSGTGHTADIGNAQDIDGNLLGKILRVDVHGDDFVGDDAKNYAVPTSNPFVAAAGDDEIWSFGLRNPFRSSFDRATGDLWIGDVGQDRREEVDFQSADSSGGENYGWRLREGTVATPSVGGPLPAGAVQPIYDYDHNDVASPQSSVVVIGGYVYRGPVAAFQGHYVFADAGIAAIWKLDPDAVDPRASVRRINDQLTANAGSVGNLSSFGEDAAGNLYMTELSGEIFRVATQSQDAVWNGNDAAAGAPGDGASWSDGANWTRGDGVDQAFVAEDRLVFAPGSTAGSIELGGDRTASAVAFQAPYTLQGGALEVLSGNIEVGEGVVAVVDSVLAAESSDHSLRKLGPGTLLVNGNVGQMVVKDGTLGGNGVLDYLTVRGGGEVAPGPQSGELSVTHDFFMADDSTLTLQVGGPDADEFGRLNVGGFTTFAGALRVELVDLGGSGVYQPRAGDAFPFLTAQGGATGNFATLDLPALGADLEWALTQGDVVVALVVNSTLEADFDNNGIVDDVDLDAWASHFGTIQGAGRFSGDADRDFDVDGNDFLVWQGQLGSAAEAAPASAVPEPATWMLVLIAIGGRAFMPETRRRAWTTDLSCNSRFGENGGRSLSQR